MLLLSQLVEQLSNCFQLQLLLLDSNNISMFYGSFFLVAVPLIQRWGKNEHKFSMREFYGFFW